jgi:hypothetical protein
MSGDIEPIRFRFSPCDERARRRAHPAADRVREIYRKRRPAPKAAASLSKACRPS